VLSRCGRPAPRRFLPAAPISEPSCSAGVDSALIRGAVPAAVHGDIRHGCGALLLSSDLIEWHAPGGIALYRASGIRRSIHHRAAQCAPLPSQGCAALRAERDSRRHWRARTFRGLMKAVTRGSTVGPWCRDRQCTRTRVLLSALTFGCGRSFRAEEQVTPCMHRQPACTGHPDPKVGASVEWLGAARATLARVWTCVGRAYTGVGSGPVRASVRVRG
jgi:hypothetical protein